jgi:phage baseplate assembly protein W
MNPNFGCDLKKFLFEGITDNNVDTLRNDILSSVSLYIPEITITNITLSPNIDNNLVGLTIDYRLNISNAPDQVTVQFT